jgi:hypothetical protein
MDRSLVAFSMAMKSVPHQATLSLRIIRLGRNQTSHRIPLKIIGT